MPRALFVLVMLLCSCDERPTAPARAPGPTHSQDGPSTPKRAMQPEGVACPVGVTPDEYFELGEVTAGDRVYVKAMLMETQPFDESGSTLGLLGIECPSPDEPLGKEALAFTRDFLATKEAWVVTPWKSKTDPAHGSCYLYRCPGGELINAELVRAGYARVKDIGDPGIIATLKRVEAKAKGERLGIWR